MDVIDVDVIPDDKKDFEEPRGEIEDYEDEDIHVQSDKSKVHCKDRQNHKRFSIKKCNRIQHL